jgi:pimeloyl-ACP methyl ester carboxylesterase
MTLTTDAPSTQGHFAHANGIEIYYVEAGQGEPLVLLHGGVVTTNPIWAGAPVAYASHMTELAHHFRVIAPDTRGCGRTPNASGETIIYRLLADDVVALIDALGLDRPALCGFSDGGITAMVVGIRHPDAARAIVNDAG